MCPLDLCVYLQLFKRNLKTRPTEDLEEDEERLELEATEVMREEDRSVTGNPSDQNLATSFLHLCRKMNLGTSKTDLTFFQELFKWMLC